MQPMKILFATITISLISCSGLAQNLKWSAFVDTSTTFSTPRGVDLTNNGILDIVIGGGLDGAPQSNGVNAINGVDGSILWNFPTNEEIFGSANFMDITGDGIEDVFIGGRYAEFYAINGSTGNMLWEFFPSPPTSAIDSGWFNFYNPQFIPDQNFDGIPDILVANGGNHSAPPWDTLREPGMLMVIDALSGNILAKDTMPDGEETYCAPVVVDYSGQLHIIYGSGGENDKGALWRVSLSDLMADNLENSQMLVSDSTLGFIAPSSIADMNNDEVLDIINQAYDGTIRCFDGGDNSLIWEVVNAGTESSSGPTIGNFIGDATPDVFNVLYKGVAPSFVDFYQVLIDGATGEVVWKDSIADMHYGSSSSADLDLNGRDEVIVSVNYYNGASFSHQILNIDFQNNLITPMYIEEPGVNLAVTTMIEDIDNNGYLDFIFGYRADSMNPMGQNGFFVKCIEGTNTIPGTGVAWGNYQGTNKDNHYTYTGVNCGTVTATSVFNNISCNNWADGSVTVTPITGVEPFTYLWSTGDITNSIDSMDVGNYSVRVTDSTGCYAELSFNTFNPYTITFGGISAPGCPNDSTGIATVNSSGCPCMFSTCLFDWGSGDNTKTSNSLASGWQYLAITHMDGCIVADSVFIPQATPLLDSMLLSNITCATDPYASSFIELYLSDSLNTEITWNTGDSSTYIDSLNTGMYQVNLYDSIRECFYSDTIAITASDTLQIDITTSNLQCNNDSSGMINILVTGGVPSYEYNWSTMDTTSSIINLNIGYYSVQVIDSVGCIVQLDNIEITQPDSLSVNLITTSNLQCHNDSSGTINTLVTGGVPSYEYNWSTMDTTSSIINLNIGYYSVQVIDSVGCMVQLDNIEITQPDSLSVNTLSFWNDSLGTCVGGAISMPNGGTIPYNFIWDDPQSTMNDSVTNLCAGTYQVMVTDSNACIAYGGITILNTLGIDESSINSLLIHPNPTSGVLIISGLNKITGVRAIEITSPKGDVIMRAEGGKENINVSMIETGVYFLSINHEKGTETIRFVKQ